MEYSDLSGDPLESDAATTVTCQFEDGVRRALTITAAERADLTDKGTDLTRRHDRARHWLSKHFGKLGLWALGLLVASLAIPALTKQWSDRQQELQIKDTIMTELSQASVAAFAGVKDLRELTREKAVEERRKLRREWEKAEGALDARYNVYFQKSAGADEWSAYRVALFVYIALGCCDSYRSVDLDEVRAYLNDHPRVQERPAFDGDPWKALACGPHETCEGVSPDYDRAYIWLGKEILDRRLGILRTLRDAKASGYSRGFGDFVDDVFSPLGA